VHEKCTICPLLENPKHQILVTKYWAVNLGNDQLYLGRAFVTIREHKGSLGELSEEEWADLGVVVRTLEKAYKEAFGAAPINWTCMMNHSYKKDPVDPHIYWHVFPRYRNPVTLAGITFNDDVYGEHYELDAVRDVSDEVVEEIATRLAPYLTI